MDTAPVLGKEFIDIQGTIECGFTLKRVRDTMRTYNQVNIFGCGVGFDACGRFLLSDNIGFDKKVIIFGADKISSVHVDNRKK